MNTEFPFVLEALSYYNIAPAEITLLRHNENMTFRVNEDYLLQIHKPIDGFQLQYLYEGFDRMAIYETELDFQAYLMAQGMTVRVPVENCWGKRMTRLKNGIMATVSKWIDGVSLDTLTLNDTYYDQIGAMVAKLHRCAKGFRGNPCLLYNAQHCMRLKKRFLELDNAAFCASYSELLTEVCHAVGKSLSRAEEQGTFQMLHADLSPSNILETKNGLTAIDFSLFGMGHPMLDLAELYGNIGGLASRQKIAEGYIREGGTIDYGMLDACFVETILDGLAIHFDQWHTQDWFEDRMTRWCRQSFIPFCSGERLFSDDMYVLHAEP